MYFLLLLFALVPIRSFSAVDVRYCICANAGTDKIPFSLCGSAMETQKQPAWGDGSLGVGFWAKWLCSGPN